MTEEVTMTGIKEHLSPLAEKLGISCTSAGADKATYVMPFREDNTTVADIVHGGGILTLADCAATGAAWSVVTDPANYRGLTIDLAMSFCSAAHGCDLKAEATVTKRGSNICFCDVVITAEEGTLVAQARVTYKLNRIRSPAETLALLFEGRGIEEQVDLMAELERAGAAFYRLLAETAEDRRDDLLASAVREETNAALLEQMASSAATQKTAT